MNTITLHFNDKITEKLKAVLATFSAEDLQVEISNNSDFIIAKNELQKDYDYSQSPGAEFYSLEEVKEIYKISPEN